MSAAPYRPLGVGKNGTTFSSNASPVGPARESFYSENGAVSSVVTLTDNTTVLEVAAVGTPVAIRWIATTDTAASVLTSPGSAGNFDDVIPAGQSRVFPIPQEGIGVSSIVGEGVQAGLYRRVAWKNFGANGSIIGVEF